MTPPEQPFRLQQDGDDPSSALGRRLDSLMGEATVPASVDRVMIDRIETHWKDHVARPRRTGRWGTRVAGIAAAALLAGAVWVYGPWSSPQRPIVPPGIASESAPDAGAIAGDMDGDGQIDMLDAYLLGRQLASSTVVARHQDLTGDGLVTDADVHVIAHRAVSLSKETSS